MTIPAYLVKFIAWIKLKVRIYLKPIEKTVFFNEREIWWAQLGANIGYEQDGKNQLFERPVLIIKKFNKDLLWIIPLTRTAKSSKYYFRLEQNNENSFVILSQLRTISSKRLLRKMRTIKLKEFVKLKQQIIDLLL